MQFTILQMVEILKEELEKALRTVYDPELQLDIWSLGLIYGVKINGSIVDINMTLTTPFCPYGPQLLEEVEEKLMKVQGVTAVNIELVFDPPWQPSDDLRAMLGV